VVKDYEYRMYHYSDELKSIINMCKQKSEDLIAQRDNKEGWSSLANDTRNDVVIDCKPSPRGNNIMRAVGHIPFTPAECLACITNGNMRKDYDENIDEAMNLKMIGFNTYITY
jgi:hypothetical protein